MATGDKLKTLMETKGAAAHNAIYRGKNLGTEVTAAQYAAIADGSFDDLFIGDRWTRNGRIWIIADFGYYLGIGDTACNTPHILVVPGSPLYNAQMHNTESGAYESGDVANTTAGGYAGSDMRTKNLERAKEMVAADFGSDHMLNHRVLLCNAVSNGKPSGWAWYDSTMEIPTERQTFGNPNWGQHDGNGYDGATQARQLAIFRFLNHIQVFGRNTVWEQDVISAAGFAGAGGGGQPHDTGASDVLGVCPVVPIK